MTTINLNRSVIYGNEFVPDEGDEGLFYNSTKEGQTTVELGEQVTTIQSYMFYGVPMERIYLPSNLYDIYDYGFGKCGLNRIFCTSNYPPTLHNKPFGDDKPWKMTYPHEFEPFYTNTLGKSTYKILNISTYTYKQKVPKIEV